MGLGKERQLRVARIGKPHGIRGEVTVEVFTDSPDKRFAAGNVLQVVPVAGARNPFEVLTVRKARWNKNILLLQFLEFDDRNTAELLRNSELYATADEVIDNEESWYADELIGFSVFEQSLESAEIGKVMDLLTSSVQDLLKVQLNNGREVLIPFVEEIVPEIDAERGVVIITPPPGLLELNQD